MPFLHDLQKAAIVIPINGAKKLGSANSDFEIFTGNIASSNYIHYTFTKNIPKLSFIRDIKENFTFICFSRNAIFLHEPGASIYSTGS